MIKMSGLISSYEVESVEAAIRRINHWIELGLVSEKDCCEFIIQLFHQIPESIYNEIVEKSCE